MHVRLAIMCRPEQLPLTLGGTFKVSLLYLETPM